MWQKDADCSALSKMWKMVKGKHKRGLGSKHQDRKLRNRKWGKKGIKNKWAETGFSVCDQNVRFKLKY